MSATDTEHEIALICTPGGWNILGEIVEIGPEWITLGARATIIRWGSRDGIEFILNNGPHTDSNELYTTKMSEVISTRGLILNVNALRIDYVNQEIWRKWFTENSRNRG